MKKLHTSQARAVVGGGWFSSLVKVTTGSGLFGGLTSGIDPVATTIAATKLGGGLTTAFRSVMR